MSIQNRKMEGNITMFKEAKWIVPESLQNMLPINVFHKECMPRSIELPEQLKNLHILYRSTFSIPVLHYFELQPTTITKYMLMEN